MYCSSSDVTHHALPEPTRGTRAPHLWRPASLTSTSDKRSSIPFVIDHSTTGSAREATPVVDPPDHLFYVQRPQSGPARCNVGCHYVVRARTHAWTEVKDSARDGITPGQSLVVFPAPLRSTRAHGVEASDTHLYIVGY
jgi:hypothetical protein